MQAPVSLDIKLVELSLALLQIFNVELSHADEQDCAKLDTGAVGIAARRRVREIQHWMHEKEGLTSPHLSVLNGHSPLREAEILHLIARRKLPQLVIRELFAVLRQRSTNLIHRLY